MYIELVESTPNGELVIERAMRVCHGGDLDENGKPNKNFIQSVIKLGHESVLEHASATFKICEVSRALTHQLVRHRLSSFTQESQRYVKKTNFDYVMPEVFKEKGLIAEYTACMQYLQELYNKFIDAGVKREDARYILPNACTTNIWMTCNLRQWRSVIKLRSDSHAQAEIQELSDMLLHQLYETYPIVFEDLFVQRFPDGFERVRYDNFGNEIERVHIGPQKENADTSNKL